MISPPTLIFHGVSLWSVVHTRIRLLVVATLIAVAVEV
jgi:hypothetical protein